MKRMYLHYSNKLITQNKTIHVTRPPFEVAFNYCYGDAAPLVNLVSVHLRAENRRAKGVSAFVAATIHVN